MIAENIIVSTEVMPLDKAKELGAMALFTEKYGNIVRVVKIGKSIELCGGTHATNTSEIGKFAIYNCESKGSNVYRIEAVTADEKLKLLIKAKEILEEAKNAGIKLEFDVDVSNDNPESYKDIIYSKNELQYVHQEVKELEKKYYEIRTKETLENLDIYKENVKVVNGVELLIMKLDNKDTNLLKAIADELINEMKNAFIFFINVKEDGSVNFIAKSSSFVNAGLIVKDASVSSNGNGGGSQKFAQGGGKTTKFIPEIVEHVEKVIEENV